MTRQSLSELFPERLPKAQEHRWMTIIESRSPKIKTYRTRNLAQVSINGALVYNYKHADYRSPSGMALYELIDDVWHLVWCVNGGVTMRKLENV